MSLNIEQVRQVAHLARLQLAPGQDERYARQLSDILALVDQLTSVATDGVEPMAHPTGMTQRLRDDAVSEADRREVYQSVAPAVDAGLFLVPKVLE